ncbi:MAG TPA: alpha/beta fold hydrolase [Pirellulales bacterium]|nr:alpha/beta fold hydrolase [Pirellulales bacterium]
MKPNPIRRAALAVGVALTLGCNPAADKPAVEPVAAKPQPEAVEAPPAEQLPAAPTPETSAAAEKPAPAKPMPAKLAAPDEAPPAAAERKRKARTAEEPEVSPAAEPDYLKDAPLIPRETLFGNPDRTAARVSPDGKQLAYLAPVNGVLNVWVGPIDEPSAAQPVTEDKLRGIRSYFWAYTNEHVLYVQDAGGDEDWHVYRVDLATRKTLDLTPLKGVNAQVQGVSHRIPDEILVGLNDRDPQVHDIYRVKLDSGDRELIEKNTEQFAGYVTDEDFRVRFGSRMLPDGGNELLGKEGGAWKPFVSIPREDTLTTSPLGFDKSGDVLYFMDSRNRDTGALTAWNLNDGKQSVLAENPRADLGELLLHPTENTVEAVSFTYLRKEWKPLDPSVADDFEYLRTVADGDISIVSQTLDNRRWIVAFLLDDGPIKYYRYDRGEQPQATFLFNNRDDLEGLPLVEMHPTVIESRDGLKLVSYYTLPPGSDADGDGRPDEPLPTVLNVHGGPWARDDWGFDAEHQLLANRGYAVLAVNFRGSTGFGKSFVNAGNQEWAGKMHDDLLDAVDWAVKQKIADPKRIAIMGGSYGGYATLVGLTFSPEVFACGVDIVGPSNILTLLSSIPPYWRPMLQMFKDRVGDFGSREGKEFLTQRSPLSRVESIARPLLIAQGKNDPKVKQAEADQIVGEMQLKKIPVTYVLYPDEGHGFARPQNRLSFNAVSEAFLAEHLGGRFEPIGWAFHGSTITVPVGAEQVPGLKEALDKHQAAATE